MNAAELIESVAKALKKQWPFSDIERKAIARTAILATLDAVREPNREMLVAAMRPGDGLLPGRENAHSENGDTWRAMIDALKREIAG